ncbi:MAG: hypothetical protein AAFP04_05360 [Myxococcota bacterium]
MRWNGFFRSIAFAAVAALAYLPTLGVFGPWLGYRESLIAFIILSSSVYAMGLVPERRRGLAAAAFIAAVGTGAAVVASPPHTVALVALVAIGVVRSGWLRPMPFGRAAWIELMILFGSALLGSFLVGRGALGGAFAVWGVGLIQSVYFLLVATSARSKPRQDPFEVARRRAMALLEEAR